MIKIAVLKENKRNPGHKDLFIQIKRLRLVYVSDTFFWRDRLPKKDIDSALVAGQALVLLFQEYLDDIHTKLSQLKIGQTLFYPFDLADQYEDGLFFTRLEEDMYTLRGGYIPSFTYGKTSGLIVSPDMDIHWLHVPQRVQRQRLLAEIKEAKGLIQLVEEKDINWLLT